MKNFLISAGPRLRLSTTTSSGTFRFG